MGESILVVDDEPFVRDVLQQTLSLQGYGVETAADGKDALAHLEAREFTLVLTDLRMPRMTGMELLAEVRRRWPHTGVIVITAVGDVSTAVQAMGDGAYDYLTKPFDLSALPFAVARALERRSLVLAEEEYRRSLEEKNAELLRLEALKADLTQMVVHDLRNPLTGLVQSLELIRLAVGEAPGSRIPRWLDRCDGCCRQMLDMADNLLDLGRMEEGRIALDRSPALLADLMRATVETLQETARRAEVALVVEAPPDLDSVAVDASMVRRVLANLVTNAVKFSPRGGSVRVCLQRSAAGEQILTVTDSGPGIPPELRERVFDKYAQASIRKAAGMRSFGLGLTFCKLAVEAHGGRIWIDSAPGGGAVVGFALPAAE